MMLKFGNKIERLEKFIIKAVTKAINAGENIIRLYIEGGEKIEHLKNIVARLKKLLFEIEGKNE